ncbi:MAG TPA: hypothetical protein VFE03_13975 [Caulobacteraceae bacterium]|nr:hypothetical protein [Caulobacteraceae bacterium]
MDPIANTDRLILLLRERLLERVKTAGVPGRQRGATDTSQALIDNLQALAAVDGVEDRQLGRALIQRILSEELGSDLLNEAKFQLVVDQVTDTLRAEPATAGLLSRIVGELRAAAR